VQRLYEAVPEVFVRLIGRPAPPDQSANDFTQALATPGRFRYVVALNDGIIGLADCKLDDEVPGLGHLGLLLLAPPYDDPLVAALVLRIIMRWMARLGVTRVQTGVPAHSQQDVAFWSAQGFEFTGAQYRRDLPGHAPRFLVMARDLAPGAPE
jgi:hypothetical protein